MRIVFDAAKDAADLAKHNVWLALGALVLEKPVGEVVDDRRPHGEVRINAFGWVGNRLFACTCTRRGDVRRIISSRRANKREQGRWLL